MGDFINNNNKIGFSRVSTKNYYILNQVLKSFLDLEIGLDDQERTVPKIFPTAFKFHKVHKAYLGFFGCFLKRV